MNALIRENESSCMRGQLYFNSPSSNASVKNLKKRNGISSAWQQPHLESHHYWRSRRRMSHGWWRQVVEVLRAGLLARLERPVGSAAHVQRVSPTAENFGPRQLLFQLLIRAVPCRGDGRLPPAADGKTTSHHREAQGRYVTTGFQPSHEQ